MESNQKITRNQLSTIYRGWDKQQFDHREFIDHLLGVGLTLLDLDIAIVSRIEGRKYIVEHCVGGEIPIGQEFRLSITYCSLTIQHQNTFSIHDVAVSEYLDHPCFKEFKLTRYIGIPIMKDGQIYGTVNFSSPESRTSPFTTGQKAIVKLIAESINLSLYARNVETNDPSV